MQARLARAGSSPMLLSVACRGAPRRLAACARRPRGSRAAAVPAPREPEPQPPPPSQPPQQEPTKLPQEQQAPADGGNGLLALPLLFASALSHVNRQYIRLRRRRRWWSKMGGYPRVPADKMAALPEPAVELWHKVLPLGLVFFCASFNLTILQSLKDAIVVTAGGAEVLPFLASFCVLPASLAYFVLYGKLVSALPERSVFYAAVCPLLLYYALFAVVLYPAAPSLHPLDAAAALGAALPTGLGGLVKLVGNWTYSLFACAAELWGAVVISVLFWSLANEVVTVDEAKAVYPFMAIGANVALVAAGVYIRVINHAACAACPPGSSDGQLLALRLLLGTVGVVTAVMFAAKAYIDARVLPPPPTPAAALASSAAVTTTTSSTVTASATGGPAAAAAPGTTAAAPAPSAGKRKSKASKGSFAQGLAVLRDNPKVRDLALLVMSYGISHRLFEFAWKGQLRVLYPTVQGYQAVLAEVASWTGMLTLGAMVVSRLVFAHAGWGVAASVTPAVMGLSGLAFFGCGLAATAPGATPEMAATLAAAGATAGVVTQVFARASKYSFMDPAKEMCFIEMDSTERKQGKAAVDLVGSQIGKSGGAWVTQALLLCCGSIAGAMPFTSVIFGVVIITWLRATVDLHKQMQAVERARAAAAAAAAVQAAAGAPSAPAADSNSTGERDGGGGGGSSSSGGGGGSSGGGSGGGGGGSGISGTTTATTTHSSNSSGNGGLDAYLAVAVNAQLQGNSSSRLTSQQGAAIDSSSASESDSESMNTPPAAAVSTRRAPFAGAGSNAGAPAA